ncbi:MAG: hypothetical protein ACLFPE_12580 [Bacteroidales bacterium]
MKNMLFLVVMLLLSALISCSSSKQNKSGNMAKNGSMAGTPSPPAIIYKTGGDYFYHVPVTLNDQKTRVASFPAFSDLKRNGEFVYPTRLENGWLLDNRGIGPNTVFLRFTYQDYYTMDNIPNAERLMNYIIDMDPFTEMYECGRRGDYGDIEAELNEMIRSGKLDGCRKLTGK